MANLTVKSETKEQAGDMNVAGDFHEAFDAKARELLAEAKRRAEANGRKTIQPSDL